MRRKWTDEEMQYLRDNYPDERTELIARKLNRSITSVYNMATLKGIKKSQAFKADLKKSGHVNLIKYPGDRFQPGHKPWNKGKKVPTRGRMRETQFKKGQLPHNTMYDGAISVRVSQGRPYKWVRVSVARWELLHRRVWMAHHGEIPKGYNVQFKDRNTLNCTIENLHLVSRVKNMKQNTIHNYPAPIKKTIRTIHKLDKAIRNAQK